MKTFKAFLMEDDEKLTGPIRLDKAAKSVDGSVIVFYDIGYENSAAQYVFTVKNNKITNGELYKNANAKPEPLSKNRIEFLTKRVLKDSKTA